MKYAEIIPGRHYDLVFVVEYYRSAAAVLSLIRGLSAHFTIGLYVVPISAEFRRKAGPHQEAFISACKGAGAEVIGDQRHTCDVMVVQQRPYSAESVQDVLERVCPKFTVGLMALAMAGLPLHDRFLEQFNIRKVYVPNERFMRFLLDERQGKEAYHGIAVQQVGLPFRRMPLVDDFEADWIVAAPTPLSFRREHHKHAFLRTVLQLLDQVGASEIVVYKPHNSEFRDYLAPLIYSRLAQLLVSLPGIERLVGMASMVPGVAGKHAGKLLTALLHERVVRRCIPLHTLCDLYWLPLEAFLPFVKRGVIGGLSNTIWGTLYFGLPFLNCVDRSLRDSVEPDFANGGKNSGPYLDVNLRFFELPFCDGRLCARRAHRDDVITEVDHEGDLIDAILIDLAAVKGLEC